MIVEIAVVAMVEVTFCSETMHWERSIEEWTWDLPIDCQWGMDSPSRHFH